jgi:cytoskeletal protein RodZ
LNDIGNQLKKAREATGITLEEVSSDLDIKVNVLDNIENGNMGCFKDIYVLKDYIQEYSKYLGLDPEKMVNEFNEYLFETTSKISVKEIEEKMQEIEKNEETQEIKIASPYTDDSNKYKSKSYIMLYILIIMLVALAIFWSVKQITVDSRIATMISYIK